MSTDATKWITCDVCREEWTEDAFKAGGSAYGYAGGRRMCSACFQERYPKRSVVCSGCGRRMTTRGRGEATCRACRQARKAAAPPPPPVCPECEEPYEDRPVHGDGRCYRCYLRAWRRENGINGRQTLGAWSQAA